MRKIKINEHWEEEEIIDPRDLCAVILKQGSSDCGYVKSFNIDDIKVKTAYDELVSQYQDTSTDNVLNIYLVKLPNTRQVASLLDTANYNGEERDPEAIAAVNALCNRPDCEILESWSPTLTEAKKKKKVCDSITYTTGYPDWDIKHFNKMMGTDGLGDSRQSYVVGDTLPNSPVADAGDANSDGASEASSEGGAVGESLKEDKEFEIKIQDNENIEEDSEELNPPIDLEYFPNNMGINLSSVKKEKWVEQDDGQLKKIEIEFDPVKDADGADLGESRLTEVTLNYSVQLEKMREIEAGTRGFNVASASLEKILFNYDICISHNLPIARKKMEDALRLHGWDRYIKSSKININKDFVLDDYTFKDSRHINAIYNNITTNWDTFWSHATWSDALSALLIALFSRKQALSDSCKDAILNRFNLTLDELKTILGKHISNQFINADLKRHCSVLTDSLHEEAELTEAKRYVKRYYIRPQNIFASNKEDILKALVKIGDQNCSVYSLKNLKDHDDVQLLQPSDIIYYYDDHVLYDKNHVQVMDYDLFVKHEEERKKFADVDAVSDATFDKEYDDRLTDADLKDKETVANFRAINARQMK